MKLATALKQADGGHTATDSQQHKADLVSSQTGESPAVSTSDLLYAYGGQNLKDYFAEVARELRKHSAPGISGRTVITFAIGSNGLIEKSEIYYESTDALADKSALAAVKELKNCPRPLSK